MDDDRKKQQTMTYYVLAANQHPHVHLSLDEIQHVDDQFDAAIRELQRAKAEFITQQYLTSQASLRITAARAVDLHNLISLSIERG